MRASEALEGERSVMDDVWGSMLVILAVAGVVFMAGGHGMWLGLLGLLAANIGAFVLAGRRRTKRLAAASDREVPPGPGPWFDLIGAGWSAIIVSMIVATGLQYLSHEALLEAWIWLLSALPAAVAPLALGREGVARAAEGYRRLLGRGMGGEEDPLPGPERPVDLEAPSGAVEIAATGEHEISEAGS